MRKLQGVASLTALTASLLIMPEAGHAAGDVRAAAQNPISSMISLPLKLILTKAQPMATAPF